MRPPQTPSDAVRALRIGAVLLALAGVALLVVTTFATVKEIRVGSATDPLLAGGAAALSGWDRHGPALLVLAVLAVPLAGGALRAARAAALALAVTGLATLLIALVADLPGLHDPGPVALAYADSAAGAGAGWYTETAGAVALLVAGVVLTLLAGAPQQRARPGDPRIAESRPGARSTPTAARP
jgi:hypothetical protein